MSRLTGLPRGKATETYCADPDGRQLTVTVWFDRVPGPLRHPDGTGDASDVNGSPTFV
ncbi:MAG: hypothetical protein AB7N65_05495 [Vicinamibacterales bacterium]